LFDEFGAAFAKTMLSIRQREENHFLDTFNTLCSIFWYRVFFLNGWFCFVFVWVGLVLSGLVWFSLAWMVWFGLAWLLWLSFLLAWLVWLILVWFVFVLFGLLFLSVV
jgi:hypothetical protein